MFKYLLNLFNKPCTPGLPFGPGSPAGHFTHGGLTFSKIKMPPFSPGLPGGPFWPGTAKF